MSFWDDKPSPHAHLAEILANGNIGLSHVRLIGEILVADATLNSWFYTKGKQSVTIDEWADWAELYTEFEDRYLLAWKGLVQTDLKDRERKAELLKCLEVALNGMAEGLRNQLIKFQELYP